MPYRGTSQYQPDAMQLQYIRRVIEPCVTKRTAPTHLHRLHDTALVRGWSDALILSQVRRCLLDEITSLVEADPVSFRIAYCLTNAKVIRPSGVAVFSGAFEVLNRFLLEFRHCPS
jgi:hypothetical protein